MRINDWNDIVFRNKNKFYPKIVLHKILEGLILLVFGVIYYMRIFKMKHTIKESNDNFNAIHISQTATFLYHFQPDVASLGNLITLHLQLFTIHAVFSVLWNHQHSPAPSPHIKMVQSTFQIMAVLGDKKFLVEKGIELWNRKVE